jgi:hypothetical protein
VERPDIRHSFAKPEGDGKLARRTFIAEAVMLPLAIKIGLAFASEAAGSDSGAQSAITLARDALARATELSHLYSIAFARMTIACVYQIRREAGLAEAAARELSTLCREHEFNEMLGWGQWVLGWAVFEQNQAESALEKVAESIDFHESVGGTVDEPWRRGVLAEGYARAAVFSKPGVSCSVRSKPRSRLDSTYSTPS